MTTGKIGNQFSLKILVSGLVKRGLAISVASKGTSPEIVERNRIF